MQGDGDVPKLRHADDAERLHYCGHTVSDHVTEADQSIGAGRSDVLQHGLECMQVGMDDIDRDWTIEIADPAPPGGYSSAMQ